MAPLGNHLAFHRPTVFYSVASQSLHKERRRGYSTRQKSTLESSNCLSLFAYLSTRANKDGLPSPTFSRSNLFLKTIPNTNNISADYTPMQLI